MRQNLDLLPVTGMQAYLNTGMSIRDVAKLYNNSIDCIYALINKGTLTKLAMIDKERLLPIENMQIDLNNKMSIQYMAKKYIVNPDALYKLIKSGILNKPSNLRKIQLKDVNMRLNLELLPLPDMQKDLDMGVKIRDIATHYNISVDSMYSLIHKGALKKLEMIKKESLLPLENIQADLNDRISVLIIAKKYNINPSALYKLINNGILNKPSKLHKIRTPKSQGQKIKYQNMQNDLDQGLRVKTVADKYHFSRQYVYSLIKDGILVKQNFRKNITVNLDQYIKDLNQGLTKKEASIKQGFHPYACHIALKRAIKNGTVPHHLVFAQIREPGLKSVKRKGTNHK
jgi:Mor family transcriptional regulator